MYIYIYIYLYCVCIVTQDVRLFVTPWTVACQELSRQEYWSGLPFPSPYMYIYIWNIHI